MVTVGPRDFGDHPLAGVDFQRKWEEQAFIVGGRNYHAPIQTVGHFLGRTETNDVQRKAYSYEPGVTPADIRQCLPEYVTNTLAEALPYFGRRIQGFDADHVCMTGVETRTSAPLRIVRDENRLSQSTKGLYPIGEGAGYAGGIMSAALGGAETAILIMNTYGPLKGDHHE